MRIDLENFQEIERDEAFDWAPKKRKGRRRKPRFIKILIALILTLLIVILIGYLTLKFFVGPIVKTVDGLPLDFPADMPFYETDQAKINLEDSAGKAKIIAGLKSMPDFVLTLFLNVLSDDLKRKLADNFGDDINIPKNFSVDDLKEALKTVDLDKTRTVNLSWPSLGKTKEEIAAFYKQKLQENNFQFKENLTDYQINLGFWKDGIFGLMSFSDKKEDVEGGIKYNTQADITVNYLNELKNNEARNFRR
ncbi:MAG: hypothetical protein Q7K65_04820 [Candidatus Buchananbacteria bacterium]|nr:hypothetical protein [Candidatus Buchananbacteria bacterium]